MARSFCKICGTALWGWHPDWPDLLHPFASAIDTDLPVPPARSHIMLDFKAPWVGARYPRRRHHVSALPGSVD